MILFASILLHEELSDAQLKKRDEKCMLDKWRTREACCLNTVVVLPVDITGK
jgi:hypothetical protein